MAKKKHYYGLSLRMSMWMLLALLGSMALQAKEIDVNQATSIAENFFNGKIRVNNGKAVKAKSVDAPKGVSNLTNETAYYVFTPEEAKGFVIVSAEDEAAPIVGYSLDSNYDPENLPEGLVAYLSDYSKIVKAISDGKITYKSETRGGEAVAPLLKVKWNQGNPYNLFTPVSGENHVPTGCVATAVAQVMKYYEFPPKGNGTAGKYSQSVELGHEYNWSNMLDEYTGWDESTYNYTEEQAIEVATLMRDIGYALFMEYSSSGSGALSQVVAGKMCQHFNYSPDITFCDRRSYSTQGWIDEIRGSLLRKEPVIFSGSDGKTGHEFVCDGIDADDLVHINWGWGGMSDGFFDVNILSPSNLGIGAGNGAYFRDQDIVINIRPGDPEADYLSQRLPLTIFGVGVINTDDDGKMLVDQYPALTSQHMNTTGDYLNGTDYYLGAQILNSAGESVGIYGLMNAVSMDEGYWTYPTYYHIPLKKLLQNGDLPDGKYTLKMVCLPGDIDENAPNAEEILPINDGDLNRVDVTVKEGEMYLDDKSRNPDFNYSQIKVLDVEVPGTLYTGISKNRINLKMVNVGTSMIEDASYSIRIIPIEEESTLTSPSDWNDYWAGNIEGVVIYPGVTQEVPVDLSLNGFQPGKYRLYVTYFKSGLKEAETEKPIYIEIVDMPKDRLIITGDIYNYWPETRRLNYTWTDVEFTCYNPMNTFNTCFQIWVRPKGGDDESEYLMFQSEEQIVNNGENFFNIWGSGEYYTIWYEELGAELEGHIRYLDADGNLVDMAGNNSYVFTIVDDEMADGLTLSSDIVINGGDPVEATDGSSFEVEFEVETESRITLYEGYSYLYVTRALRNEEILESFINGSTMSIEKTELAAGEKTKCRAFITYKPTEDEEDLVGLTLYIKPCLVGQPEDSEYAYSYNVQPNPYLKSISFKLVEPTGSAIDDVTNDRADCIVKTSRGRITVDNLAGGSTVEVYNVSGVRLAEKAADAEGTVTVEVTGGIYLVRVKDAVTGGSTTVKVMVL